MYHKFTFFNIWWFWIQEKYLHKSVKSLRYARPCILYLNFIWKWRWCNYSVLFFVLTQLPSSFNLQQNLIWNIFSVTRISRSSQNVRTLLALSLFFILIDNSTFTSTWKHPCEFKPASQFKDTRTTDELKPPPSFCKNISRNTFLHILFTNRKRAWWQASDGQGVRLRAADCYHYYRRDAGAPFQFRRGNARKTSNKHQSGRATATALLVCCCGC